MANSIPWEQLYRNGQLQWKTIPEHRRMVERFCDFFHGTADEGVVTSKYPGFLEARKDNYGQKTVKVQVEEESLKEDTKKDKAEGEESPEPKKKKRRSSSSS